MRYNDLELDYESFVLFFLFFMLIDLTLLCCVCLGFSAINWCCLQFGLAEIEVTDSSSG